MKVPFSPVLLFSLCAGAAFGQENLMPQFHGFVTEGFTYSNDNNYLGMNTSLGSFDWTEAALNVNDQLTPNLRVGAQIHLFHLGDFGGWVPGLDWALADYKFNQHLGVRAGKVKIRWGLYNDTQDADPGYMWSLLPEPIYAVDWRATDLAQTGVELYGRIRLGKKRGELEYSAYYGYYTMAANDGIMDGFKEDGLVFTKRPRGKTPGFDVRWTTPLKGLLIGGSLMMYDAHGNLIDGAFRQPLTYWPAYYAQYTKKKLFLSAQYSPLLERTYVMSAGTPSSDVSNTRGWFVMGGYHVTSRLQLGVYRTGNTVLGVDNPSDPSNRFRDWVVSSRFDINSYLYAKLEGHFIDGTYLGFYGFDNPNDLKPQTNLLVAKIGFCF